MAASTTPLCIIRAALAEVLEAEIALYNATRSAEWQLSCYGVAEDVVLAPHLPVLAGLIDSVLEQLGRTATSASPCGGTAYPATVEMQMTSRRSCYMKLLSLHSRLIGILKALWEILPQDILLPAILTEAIEVHTRLSTGLRFFADGGQALRVEGSFEEQDEAHMLFI